MILEFHSFLITIINLINVSVQLQFLFIDEL